VTSPTSLPTVDGEPLGIDTIDVYRGTGTTGTDRFGNPTGTPTVDHQVTGCSVQPFVTHNTTETVTPTTDTVRSRWHLFAPYGADVTESDVIGCHGLTFQVDGDLMSWEPDETGDGYAEAYLVRWKG